MTEKLKTLALTPMQILNKHLVEVDALFRLMQQDKVSLMEIVTELEKITSPDLKEAGIIDNRTLLLGMLQIIGAFAQCCNESLLESYKKLEAKDKDAE